MTEETCTEIHQVTWPHPLEEPMLLSTFHRYIASHARPKGCYVPRIARSAANIMLFHGFDRHPNTLKQAYARPTRNPADPYVIGLSERGKLACTWKQCKAVMRAAGIDELGVARHVARKTWASHALQNDVPMAKVAGVLADRETTVEKSYAFILPEHLRKAVNFRERKAA